MTLIPVLFETSIAGMVMVSATISFWKLQRHRPAIGLVSGFSTPYCSQSLDANVLPPQFNRFQGLMKVGSMSRWLRSICPVIRASYASTPTHQVFPAETAPYSSMMQKSDGQRCRVCEARILIFILSNHGYGIAVSADQCSPRP